MSQDQERIKGMIALKQRLEKRLAKMEAETKELQATLDTVNTILLEKGFRRGNIKEAEDGSGSRKSQPPSLSRKPAPPKESRPTGYQGGEPENVIPLKTLNEESLAIIYIEKDNSHPRVTRRKQTFQRQHAAFQQLFG